LFHICAEIKQFVSYLYITAESWPINTLFYFGSEKKKGIIQLKKHPKNHKKSSKDPSVTVLII